MASERTGAHRLGRDHKGSLEALFRHARSGEDDAVLDLIDHHKSRIIDGSRKGGYEAGVDPAVVANIARQKIVAGFPRFEGNVEQLGSWMWRIAYNAGIGESRKEARIRRRQIPIDLIPGEVHATSNPERDVTDRLFVEHILQQLDHEDRQLLELRYFDRLSPSEIAERLHYSPGHVRKRINRILQRCEQLSRDQQDSDEVS